VPFCRWRTTIAAKHQWAQRLQSVGANEWLAAEHVKRFDVASSETKQTMAPKVVMSSAGQKFALKGQADR
tara:strand:+ start:143984 stop:144193 length:210 start_codon:yes stop_codon:yes gene_type:complete